MLLFFIPNISHIFETDGYKFKDFAFAFDACIDVIDDVDDNVEFDFVVVDDEDDDTDDVEFVDVIKYFILHNGDDENVSDEVKDESDDCGVDINGVFRNIFCLSY